MKLLYNGIFLTLFLLSCTYAIAGSVYEETKEIKRAFDLNSESYIEIENKYGNIEILNWDKDSVLFEISVTVRSQKHHKLDEMLGRIDVDFTSASDFVLAQTLWADDVGFFTKGMYDVKKGLGSEDKIEVNYKVFMPKWVSLDIKNRFGNIFMGTHEGDLEIQVHYGDFRARKIVNGKKIEVKFGKLKVNDIEYANLKLQSVRSADIDRARDLMIESSSSELEISEAVKLNIDSKHDEVIFEEIEELSGNFSLSYVEIKSLNKSMITKSKLGTIRVKEANTSAENINLEGNKTEIYIGLDDFFEGKVELDVNDDPRLLEYPRDMEIVSSGVGDDKRLHISGKFGDGAQTLVSIKSVSGYVQIGN